MERDNAGYIMQINPIHAKHEIRAVSGLRLCGVSEVQCKKCAPILRVSTTKAK
jgi:hypothetical protein